MRKFIVAAALGLSLSVSAAGCSSAWWQNWVNNPASAAQSFEATVQVALTGAQIAWAAILPALPANIQAKANQEYMLACSAVNHALQVLNDAVTAAIAAKQSTPDFSAFMQAASDAISQIITIVDQYKSGQIVSVAKPDGGASDAGAPKAAAPVPGYDDMKAAYASLKFYGVKVK